MLAEQARLAESDRREKHWKRWGPYVAERHWGTVREDYSPNGTAWDFFPHDHARSRAYRWGEDGIAGICDNHQRLCFSLAMWNGKDPILKERLFGLSGPEGNHGEDVKEYYYYLDSTPTHSYMKCLYKYPQAEYPYSDLVHENASRGREHPEYELIDTGVFNEDRYFDIFTEYAKADVDDLLINITIVNRGPDTALLHLLPQLHFRNTWSWGYKVETPSIQQVLPGLVSIQESTLGGFHCWFEDSPKLLFTENNSNTQRLFGYHSEPRFYKDAFHEHVIHSNSGAVNPAQHGTKCAGWYQLHIPSGASHTVRLRLLRTAGITDPTEKFDEILALRKKEADEFYSSITSKDLTEDACSVQRQAFAGMLWSKQYYHLSIDQWLKGDPAGPTPPQSRWSGRNHHWDHLFNEDIISMPDKWEYPWYAAWDLAFHMIPFAIIDPDFAKSQLALFMREWYMHPNGQIPAYEWAFGDVNPPVHAWSAWRVFKIDEKQAGKPDHAFLERVFHKLLMNFTWWVNRKDSEGNNIFSGGFLGLDNIGVFDRSKPLPMGGMLEQSDGTSWMAMFCLNMLRIALELAKVDMVYEDIASKFFEHFLFISTAINRKGEGGLWDEQDGFYYDRLRLSSGDMFTLRIRSMVGLIPLFAVDTLEPETVDQFPGFRKRMEWFIANRPDLCENIACLQTEGQKSRRLLSVVSGHRLNRILDKMLDEKEFLSPYGLRSLSQYHRDHPYVLPVDGIDHRVDYEPAESVSGLFGGNSNWRGPVWFPLNFLMIESLQRFQYYYADSIKANFPAASENNIALDEVAAELSRRLSRLFLLDEKNHRPVFGGTEKFQNDPNFRDYILFYEFFHGDNGAGLGASHQTGWTGLVSKLLQQSGA